MKLQTYRTTFDFTTADIGDPGFQPPLTLTVHGIRPAGWSKVAKQYLEDRTIANAIELVGLCLISVTDEETTHRIGSAEQAAALREAVATQADDEAADWFIINLAMGIINQMLEREERLLKNSAAFSPPSSAGNANPPSTNGRTAQPEKSAATAPSSTA